MSKGEVYLICLDVHIEMKSTIPNFSGFENQFIQTFTYCFSLEICLARLQVMRLGLNYSGSDHLEELMTYFYSYPSVQLLCSFLCVLIWRHWGQDWKYHRPLAMHYVWVGAKDVAVASVQHCAAPDTPLDRRCFSLEFCFREGEVRDIPFRVFIVQTLHGLCLRCVSSVESVLSH